MTAHQRDSEVAFSESSIREIVLRRLSHAPRTRAELARDLARRGVPADIADPVLDGLEVAGVINDGLFAQMWVESRHRGRGLSSGALRRELTERGVDHESIGGALEQIDVDSEVERARELARRRLRALGSCDMTTRRRRLNSYLQRRGYPSSIISVVVGEALAADSSH